MSEKIFLITGCSSGIGRALAQDICAAGHIVYAAARNIDSLESVASTSLRPVSLDVNSAVDIAAVYDLIKRDQGRLDVLVNNAGYGAMGPLLDISSEEMRAQFDTNLFAPLQMVQSFMPLMRAADSAIIANIGSAAGFLSTPFSGAYCASKAALHTLSEVMRMELQPLGVHVMTVVPGAVSSAFSNTAGDRASANLADNSAYKNLEVAIDARARISADSPTTPARFARVLAAALLSARPPAELHIGQGSTVMPMLKKYLPRALRDRILSRKFKLDSIG